MSPEDNLSFDEPNRNKHRNWSEPKSWSEFERTHPQLFTRGCSYDVEDEITYETPVTSEQSSAETQEKCVAVGDYLSIHIPSPKVIRIKDLLKDILPNAKVGTPEHDQFQSLIAWHIINRDDKPTYNQDTQLVTDLITDDSLAYLYLSRMRGGHDWDKDWIPVGDTDRSWLEHQETRFARLLLKSSSPIEDICPAAEFGRTLIQAAGY